MCMYIYIYIYIYIHTHPHTNGVSANGVAANFMFLTEGPFGYSR